MITPEQLRKCAICVYLAAEAKPAEDINKHLEEAATTIEAQAALIQETLEVVKVLINPSNISRDRGNWNYECIYCHKEAGGNPELIQHKEDCTVVEAQSSISKLESEVKEKP